MFLFIASVLAQTPNPELHKFKPADRRLELKVEAGALAVKSDPNAKAIEVRVTPESTCTITRGNGAIAELEVVGCKADVQVVAPMGTTLRIAIGTGDVRLDTASPLRLNVGTGSVTGSARGPVKVAVGTGDVHLEGLTQEPVIAVASGKTEISYAKGG